MTIYRLTTNEGERYVRATAATLRAAMWTYIKRKRADGVALADITYAWCEIAISTTLPV